MCNRIVQKTVIISPGGKRRVKVLLEGPHGLSEHEWEEIVFTGCATREKFRWWARQGDEVTIPAEKYGEKNKTTGEQGYGIVPEGMGIKAIVLRPEPGKTYRNLKIVTTDGGEEAERLFGNNRVPLLASLANGKPPGKQPALIRDGEAPAPPTDLFAP